MIIKSLYKEKNKHGITFQNQASTSNEVLSYNEEMDKNPHGSCKTKKDLYSIVGENKTEDLEKSTYLKTTGSTHNTFVPNIKNSEMIYLNHYYGKDNEIGRINLCEDISSLKNNTDDLPDEESDDEEVFIIPCIQLEEPNLIYYSANS